MAFELHGLCFVQYKRFCDARVRVKSSPVPSSMVVPAEVHQIVVASPCLSMSSALPLAKLFQGFNPLREMRAFFLHLVQADPLCRDDAVEYLLVTRRQGANAY